MFLLFDVLADFAEALLELRLLDLEPLFELLLVVGAKVAVGKNVAVGSCVAVGGNVVVGSNVAVGGNEPDGAADGMSVKIGVGEGVARLDDDLLPPPLPFPDLLD